MSTTNLEEIKKNPRSFTWGLATDIHHIGEYDIVEYYDRKRDGCTITKEIDYDKKMYSCYINGKSISHSCDSLDLAIAQCIAEKHDGPNTQAAVFFMKMVSNKE